MEEPLLPPSLIARFASPRLLGEGAFGTVVYGEDQLTGGRPVAIKLLKAMQDPNGTWWARFEREAQLTESLDSHYVVRAFEHGVVDEQPYLVLEYVEGPTLEDHRLARGGKLPVEEALRTFVEVLFGLRAAHGQGVLHRDLKPENVLLRHGEEAVLTDFGLARDVASETLTATGTVMGTLHYMAPEMLAGQPATARSDVYAAVCLLGELLLGEVPLGGDNVGQLYDRREKGGFLGFRAEGVALPPQVDKLLARALDPDPAKRPVSAWEMSETLVDALEKERMQDLLAKVTLDGVTGAAPHAPVVVGDADVNLDAPTQEDLGLPPGEQDPEVTTESAMNLRRSAFLPPQPAEAMATAEPVPPGEGGIGGWTLAAAFVVLLGLSFGLGGGATGFSGFGGSVTVDPREVRHQEASLKVVNYENRLRNRKSPEEPSVLERFTEMTSETKSEEAQDRRYLAALRLEEGLREIAPELEGLDLRRGDRELFEAIARLRSLELLVHVTGEIPTRGTQLESPWGDQLDRVVATWLLPKPKRPGGGAPWQEGPRTWRPLWRASEVRKELLRDWAQGGVMRGWEHSRMRYDIRGRTLGGREFLYAGDDIRPMVDVFVPDRTLWVDYWPYFEVPIEAPEGDQDLVVAAEFEDVAWSFVPHLQLIGREHTVSFPVRPAYPEEARVDTRLRGTGDYPTGIRVARAVLPEGLRAMRLVNVAVETMCNVVNKFNTNELFRLEAGPLPPEAAFAAPLPEEAP